MVTETLVLKSGVASHSIVTDLNFRLRLDIGGANIRIEDKIKEVDGNWYVDPESGLDMDFDITKSYNNNPNESTITIWNLSNDTYERILKAGEDGNGVELSSAFSNDEFSLMFRGYPSKVIKAGGKNIITANQGFLKQDANAGRRGQNDLATTLTLIDGKAEIEEAFFSKSYQTSVSTELVLKDCIETFGIPIGSVAQLEHRTLRKPYFRHKSSTIMNNLAKMLNFKWSIVNGVMYVYTTDLPKQPYGIILDSNNSATPERQDDKFKTHTKTTVRANKKKGIKGQKQTTIEKLERGFMIETRLLPFLNPGIWCYCDFGILKGTKFIYKVNHQGNNYGTQAITRVYVV